MEDLKYDFIEHDNEGHKLDLVQLSPLYRSWPCKQNIRGKIYISLAKNSILPIQQEQ
jgi:hypothetical protein